MRESAEFSIPTLRSSPPRLTCFTLDNYRIFAIHVFEFECILFVNYFF